MGEEAGALAVLAAANAEAVRRIELLRLASLDYASGLRRLRQMEAELSRALAQRETPSLPPSPAAKAGDATEEGGGELAEALDRVLQQARSMRLSDGTGAATSRQSTPRSTERSRLHAAPAPASRQRLNAAPATPAKTALGSRPSVSAGGARSTAKRRSAASSPPSSSAAAEPRPARSAQPKRDVEVDLPATCRSDMSRLRGLSEAHAAVLRGRDAAANASETFLSALASSAAAAQEEEESSAAAVLSSSRFQQAPADRLRPHPEYHALGGVHALSAAAGGSRNVNLKLGNGRGSVSHGAAAPDASAAKRLHSLLARLPSEAVGEKSGGGEEAAAAHRRWYLWNRALHVAAQLEESEERSKELDLMDGSGSPADNGLPQSREAALAAAIEGCVAQAAAAGAPPSATSSFSSSRAAAPAAAAAAAAAARGEDRRRQAKGSTLLEAAAALTSRKLRTGDAITALVSKVPSCCPPQAAFAELGLDQQGPSSRGAGAARTGSPRQRSRFAAAARKHAASGAVSGAKGGEMSRPLAWGEDDCSDDPAAAFGEALRSGLLLAVEADVSTLLMPRLVRGLRELCESQQQSRGESRGAAAAAAAREASQWEPSLVALRCVDALTAHGGRASLSFVRLEEDAIG